MLEYLVLLWLSWGRVNSLSAATVLASRAAERRDEIPSFMVLIEHKSKRWVSGWLFLISGGRRVCQAAQDDLMNYSSSIFLSTQKSGHRAPFIHRILCPRTGARPSLEIKISR